MCQDSIVTGLLLAVVLMAEPTEREIGERLAREVLANGESLALERETRPMVLEAAAALIEKSLWQRFLDTGDDGVHLRLLVKKARERQWELVGCPAGVIVDLSQQEVESRLIDVITLDYPPLARQARIQGTVRVLAGFDKAGLPCGIKVWSGHPLLVASAVQAVKSARIKPFAKLARVLLSINFELTP